MFMCARGMNRCMQYLWRPEEGLRSLWSESYRAVSHHRSKEPNSGPLQAQFELLTTELSPYLHSIEHVTPSDYITSNSPLLTLSLIVYNIGLGVWVSLVLLLLLFLCFLMCMTALPGCMSTHHMCAWCLGRPDKSIGSPGTGVKHSCEPPCRCLEIDPGSSTTPSALNH